MKVESDRYHLCWICRVERKRVWVSVCVEKLKWTTTFHPSFEKIVKCVWLWVLDRFGFSHWLITRFAGHRRKWTEAAAASESERRRRRRCHSRWSGNSPKCSAKGPLAKKFRKVRYLIILCLILFTILNFHVLLFIFISHFFFSSFVFCCFF